MLIAPTEPDQTMGHLIKWIKFGVNYGVKSGVFLKPNYVN